MNLQVVKLFKLQKSMMPKVKIQGEIQPLTLGNFCFTQNFAENHPVFALYELHSDI